MRASLEELGMTQVLERIAEEAAALPQPMAPLGFSDQPDRRNAMRMLQAHRALASLSESNREEFLQLIQGLEAEVAGGSPDDSSRPAP